jgi:hypothetical protein
MGPLTQIIISGVTDMCRAKDWRSGRPLMRKKMRMRMRSCGPGMIGEVSAHAVEAV